MDMNKLMLLCMLAIACMACRKEGPQQNAIQYMGPLSQEQNISMYYSDSAKVKIHVTAPSQLWMQNQDRIFPDGIFIEFYNAEGQKATTISGKRGRVRAENGLYTVSDSVVVVNLQKQEVMTTEELNWRQKLGTIFTEKAVKIQTPLEVLTGEGLDAKQDFSWYRIRRPTRKPTEHTTPKP
jgi:LPS export ABC transporter protein LptC